MDSGKTCNLLWLRSRLCKDRWNMSGNSNLDASSTSSFRSVGSRLCPLNLAIGPFLGFGLFEMQVDVNMVKNTI